MNSFRVFLHFNDSRKPFHGNGHLKPCLGDENGFSLIEVLITLIIMSLVVLGSYAFQSNMQDISNQSNARYQMQSQGDMAVGYIRKYLEQASAHDTGGLVCQVSGSNPAISCGGIEGNTGCKNDFMVYYPTDSCISSCWTDSKSNKYHFWDIEDTTKTSGGYLFMQSLIPPGSIRPLVGDYNDGKFKIKVLKLTVVDNLIDDSLTSWFNSNNISISLALGLLDAGNNSVIESMRFTNTVQPRNRICP